MDGRHRTPWPVRPRSSLPSVAWWKGQGNCFDASRATLENVDHAATLHYPGSPPARYRLTPSSPPRSPVPGQAPTRAGRARVAAFPFFPVFLPRLLADPAPRRLAAAAGISRSAAVVHHVLHGIVSRVAAIVAHCAEAGTDSAHVGVDGLPLGHTIRFSQRKKEPGTGRARSVATEQVSPESDQKLRRGPIRNDLSFSATRASAARPKFCVNLYWPETPSDALRSTWSSFS